MSVNSNWLSSFYAIRKKSNLRIGSTHYLPTKGTQLISALITYGSRYSLNTVPGTIIKKDFCRYFPDSISWGEDLIWMSNYKNHFN